MMGANSSCLAQCKWFSNEKGFGFLIAEGWNRDIFVHKQQLVKSKIDSLTEGDKLICVVNEGKKGLYATDLVWVQPEVR